MFWIAILLSFGAIALLAWIGAAMVNRGFTIGPDEDRAPYIPGLLPPDDDDIHHHGH